MNPTHDDGAQQWLREHRAPVLLSSLVLTADDDEALRTFIQSRLPSQDLSPGAVRCAKQIAQALCYALLSEDPRAWAALPQASEVLRRVRRPSGGGEAEPLTEEEDPPTVEPESPPEVHSPPAAPTGVPLATALGSPPPAVASPWASSTPTPPRPPVEAPRVAPPSPDVTGDVVPAVMAELPFDAAAAKLAPAPVAASVAAEGSQLAGGTSFVAALSDDELEPSTPFGRARSPRIPAPAPPAHDVEGTAFMMAPFQDEPLPFEGENQAPPPVAGEISQDAAGATSFVAAVDVTPSAPMSPEAYARLVHATHQQPAAVRASVHQAHQLDEAKRAQLDEAMDDYMKRQPEAFRVYMQWVHHLRRTAGSS